MELLSEKLLRVREIGREITALSDESKKLRTEIGESEGEKMVVIDHPDDSGKVLVVTINRAQDSKDWTILFDEADRLGGV